MQLKRLQIDLSQNFGEIGNKKIELLKKELEDFYTEVQQINNGVILVNKEQESHLLITNNQVSLYYNDINDEEDFYVKAEFKNIIEKVFNKLLLEDEVKAVSTITYLIEETNNTMEKSKEILTDNDKYSFIDDKEEIKGIGYRFIQENEVSLSEFKIEPLISNDKYWFIETRINFNEQNTINNILNEIEEKLKNFKMNYDSFIKDFVN